SAPVELSDTEWTKLEWTFDLSQYTQLTEDNISKTYIYIITTPQESAAYYVDDFIMKSMAGDGTFYDDYNLTAPAAGISSTATGETYFAADAVDVDTGIISLYEKYADKFKIGGTLANDIVTNSGTRKIKIYEKLFKKHFNTTSSDGYFKMEEILKDKSNLDDLTKLTKYTFEKADKVMQFCIDNGVEVIGHALIWDKENMRKYFFNDDGTKKYKRDDLLAFMKEYINKVMKHFNGKGDPDEYADGIDYSNWHISTWDVVNEACDAPFIGDYKVKDDYPFAQAIGNDYGKFAFQYAYEADPEAELRYNDYGEQKFSKAKAVVAYLNYIDPKGLYVDKIGVQSHYDIECNTAQVEKSLKMYVDSGKKLDITELDIKAYTKAQRDAKKAIYEDGVPKTVEYKQAKILRELFDIYESMSANIDRVNFWTFTDLYAYSNKEGFDHKEYAGIFDRKFAPKPQYYILVDTQEEFNARYPDYQNSVTQ
ncbi:MAG: endo-1,4-beta-xylanase, partial [Oscillospiraceae bacterium]|nr:endo-1,4-beta-xylanase [Oscillospiraceae bacterium]